MIRGSVQLIEETGEAPASLRKKVTSKGGTTEAAFKVLDGNHVKETFIKAVKAAAERSKELAKELG
jgi:pyrroline-5-carboxylate reductase